MTMKRSLINGKTLPLQSMAMTGSIDETRVTYISQQ